MDFTTIIVWIVIIALITIIITIAKLHNDDKKVKKLQNFMGVNKDDKDSFIQLDGNKGIKLDKKKGAISFFSLKSNSQSDLINIYSTSINNLISTEVIEDENCIYKTNRGSQVGGALIGGALAGGVGAVVGGLSGSTSKQESCKKLLVRFIFNDLDNPQQEIIFLQAPIMDDKGYQKSGYIYKTYSEKMNNIMTLIKVMEKQNYQNFDTIIEEIDLSKQNNN